MRKTNTNDFTQVWNLNKEKRRKNKQKQNQDYKYTERTDDC